MRIHIGHQQNLILQDYQNLMEMMKQAFGDGEKPSDAPPPNAKIVQTEADLMMFMKGFF